MMEILNNIFKNKKYLKYLVIITNKNNKEKEEVNKDEGNKNRKILNLISFNIIVQKKLNLRKELE